ncbi:hypothetical protein TNCV_2930481 [Trichonephila clavipes]|nr:hypothetical protein TNCV_2930481 [Trichonephila clavipes]
MLAHQRPNVIYMEEVWPGKCVEEVRRQTSSKRCPVQTAVGVRTSVTEPMLIESPFMVVEVTSIPVTRRIIDMDTSENVSTNRMITLSSDFKVPLSRPLPS